MWRFRVDELDALDDWGLRYAAWIDGRAASASEVLLAWRDDPDFRSRFNAELAESPFPAFRWETPAVSDRTAGHPFEFVLLDSPGLARQPDPAPFLEHFECAGDAEVLQVPNLGGDALLIIPRPLDVPTAYGHLAAFVRGAPDPQRHALWRSVGEAMLRRIGDRPVWLSTAGAGVPWLHVRLDDRPKYYQHRPYRQPDRANPPTGLP
jgi:hypothetical protein